MVRQRRNERVEDREGLGLTVLQAPGAPELAGRTLLGTTRDLSVTGLQLVTALSVPQGTEVRVRVASREPLRVFEHIGRVAWVRALEHGGFAHGIEFTRTLRGTLEDWQTCVTARLAEAKRTKT